MASSGTARAQQPSTITSHPSEEVAMKTASVLLILLGALPALSLAFAPAPLPRRSEVRRVEVAKNVTLEVQSGRARKTRRRVIVAAVVCLREGCLEHLLTRKGRKEYEAVLAADVDAREIHKALLLAAAEPGSPARFGRPFAPARGHAIRIEVEWQEKGRRRRADAREWVREVKTKKAMTHQWVFAGSQLVKSPQLERPHYLANDGDVICVANFEGAMLDLPVRSSASSDDGLLYEAFTENVPPVGTEVSVILEPVAAAKD
jgi:hypothetical protein